MNDFLNWIKNSGIVKNLAVIGISDITATLISSVFWLHIAAILDPQQYGEINYLLSIAGIVSAFTLLGSENTLIVYTAKNVKIQSTIFFIVSIIAVISSIVLYAIFQSFETSILIIGYIVFGLASHEIIGRRLYGKYSKLIIIQRTLMVALSLGLYQINGIHGILLGVGISFLIYIPNIYRGFTEVKIDFPLFKSHFGFMMNNYLLRITESVSGNIDKLIIAPIFGFALLGNYQLGLQFLAILEIIPSIIFKYTLPNDAGGNLNLKLKKLTIICSIVLSFLAYFLIPIILPIIFPKHANSIEAIRIMSFAIIPITIGYMYSSKFLGQERSIIVLISGIIFALVLTPSILLLGKYFDSTGIVFALILSHSVHASFLMIISKFDGRILK